MSKYYKEAFSFAKFSKLQFAYNDVLRRGVAWVVVEKVSVHESFSAAFVLEQKKKITGVLNFLKTSRKLRANIGWADRDTILDKNHFLIGVMKGEFISNPSSTFFYLLVC